MSYSRTDREEVEEAFAACQAEILSLCGRMSLQTINEYISEIIQFIKKTSINYTDSLKRKETSFTENFGTEITIAANSCIVYRLVLENLPLVDTLDLPCPVRTLLREDFERIYALTKEKKKTICHFMIPSFPNTFIH